MSEIIPGFGTFGTDYGHYKVPEPLIKDENCFEKGVG
jgi:hypothetical protein